MRKNKSMKKVISLGISALVLLTLGIIFGVKYCSKDDNKDDNNKDVINIATLSEEFIEEYLEESKNIKEEDKENILIVTSKEDINDTHGATNVIKAPNNQYILQYENVEEKERALSKFSSDDSIISAEKNGSYTINETTYNSWGVESMALGYATEFANTKELNDVTVAIIDTGLDVDLANKYYSGKIAGMYNVLEGSNYVTDENGHGTHIFGTIAESTPSNVKILPIKVSTDGTLYDTDIIAAITYIVANDKADVINMSFGGYEYTKALEDAIEGAKTKNIISVAAAGNDNTSSNQYPSSFSNTISIASVDSNLNKSSFSNFGNQISFAAPGTKIKSIMSSKASISKNNGNKDGDDDHETISGTSMATPHAVSAVAILKSFNKDLTLDNIMELLKSKAVDLGEFGWDIYFGYGLISFENVEFCDGTDCDDYNVFKKSSVVPTSLEIQNALKTTYNYGTPNNLDPTPIKIYDSTGNFVLSTLGALDGVEIIGYNAYSKDEQTITIKWEGLETTFNFTNPDEWENGWTYEVIENNNVIITGINDSAQFDTGKSLYIPENIEEYNVVAIGKENSDVGIFNNKDSYKEIVLPKSLTEIKGKYTFSSFDSVEKISILSSGLNITGDYVFADNPKLVEVVGTINSLGEYTFSNDISLKKVALSDDIVEIPKGAFYSCTNLEELKIPNKLVVIGLSAFSGDYKLSNISLPEGLKIIDNYAFDNTGMENIVLPNSLEKIGEGTFKGTNIRNLVIPKNVTSIGIDAFAYCPSLEQIIVEEGNPVYDSRENCNALIETATNTILRGSVYTTVPSTVTSIGGKAFSYDLRIGGIEIPNSITSIGELAFNGCYYLEKIKIPRSVQTIETNALRIMPLEGQDSGNMSPTVLTYSDAYAKEYAANEKINYITMDPESVVIQVSKSDYKSFDKVDLTNDISSVEVYYRAGKAQNGSYIEGLACDQITEGYNIKYINDNDSFRFGDTYYIVEGTNEYGENYEKQVSVTITKATPNYTIPTNLRANIGQKLSEIVLPDGFEWMTPDTVIEEGNTVFKAKYIPDDIENYEVVENIDISISVNSSKEEIVANIVITDKVYDGTTEISPDNVAISNLEKSEYSIESLISSSAEVGNSIATIKLKLTDEKFENYTFDNGSQEKEFNIEFRIIPCKLEKPSLKITEYIYNSLEQNAILNNYQEDKMNITGNTRTDAGEQDVIISLKSNNYTWDDNSTEDVILKFKILQATPEYVIPSELVAKTGQKLSEITLPDSFEWMNPDTVIEETGNVIFKAKYIPNDTKNYKTIENIDIAINVSSKMYTVTYNSNDGKNMTSTQELEYNKKTMLNENTFERDNYKFKSWNTKEDGTGTSYSNKQEISITENLTLYAIWEETYSYIIHKYSVDETNKYIDLIEANTNIESFKNNIELNEGFTVDVDYKTINGKNLLYTGGKTRIYENGRLYIEYTNIIRGDVNGDATVDIIDYIRIMKDIMEITRLDGVYKRAADINQNNIVDIIDYIRIMKKIMEEN